MSDDNGVARALAHPLRAKLLEQLGQAPGSPSELALHLGAPLGTVAYHVRTLRGMGLIELIETIPRRGAVEHRYRARVRVDVRVERL